ncbi:MAG: PAS domain-containing protein [Pseudomonadota bacterium]
MLHFNDKSLEFLRNTRIPVSIADPQQAVCPLTFVNKPFEEITGYTEAEVIGLNCRFLQCDETNPNDVAKLRSLVENQSTDYVCLRNQRANGDMFWNLVFLSAIQVNGGTLLMGCQFDLGQRPYQQKVQDHARNLSGTLRAANIVLSDGHEQADRAMVAQAQTAFKIVATRESLPL